MPLDDGAIEGGFAIPHRGVNISFLSLFSTNTPSLFFKLLKMAFPAPIDIGPLLRGGDGERESAERIGVACREWGFFTIAGHGVEDSVIQELLRGSRAFFGDARSGVEKEETHGMHRGGRALRGYFAAGAELTSGVPDLKEGIYLGREDADSDEARAGRALHGSNVLLGKEGAAYCDAMAPVAAAVLRGVALALDLPKHFFRDEVCSPRPLELLRVFRYPPPKTVEERKAWGVGQHTDYGLVTLLLAMSPGLEVQTIGGDWVRLPVVPNTFVVNLGDVLERMTGGVFRSTLHRVRNVGEEARISVPYFYDPAFGKPMPRRLEGMTVKTRSTRWDGVEGAARRFQRHLW